MRLAMFSWETLHSFALGGVAVHVTELAAGLQRRGHEVHVITRRRPDQGHYDEIIWRALSPGRPWTEPAISSSRWT
jgi:glycosyltransferase involved in cell wall biosynthesis